MTRCTTGIWLVVLAALLSAGCRTEPTAEELAKGGVPKEARLVGQGEGFVYGVPEDGRIYVALGDKVVNMRNVRAGERFYSIGPTPGDDGSDFQNYRYYFEPVKMPRN